MFYRHTLLIIAVLSLAPVTAYAQATADGGFSQFTNDTKLNEEQLIEYLLVFTGTPYGKITPTSQGTSAHDLKRKAVKQQLDKLREHFHADPPYDGAAVQKFLEGSAAVAPPAFDTSISGITVPRTIEPSSPESAKKWLGPILVREKPDDFRTRKEATGAKIQYAHNDLADGPEHRWTTKGAVIYPLTLEWDRSGSGGGTLFSTDLSMAPAIYWNVIDGSKQVTDSIDELQFSVPFSLGMNLNSPVERLRINASPYLHTDWDFDGETLGVALTAEAITKDWYGLKIGAYRAVGNSSKATKLSEVLAYRLRIVPKLDYSNVVDSGDHSTRTTSEDWMRLGSQFEFSLRFFQKSPLELTVGYEFLTGFTGSPQFADLFTVKLTQWLYSQQVGLTLEYQDGDTPISKKRVDLLTLGLELKL